MAEVHGAANPKPRPSMPSKEHTKYEMKAELHQSSRPLKASSERDGACAVLQWDLSHMHCDARLSWHGGDTDPTQPQRMPELDVASGPHTVGIRIQKLSIKSELPAEASGCPKAPV